MSTTNNLRIQKVNYRTHQAHPESQSMRWVQGLAKLLDSKFVIPGTNIRFGLDPIMSLFPVIGDLFTYLISGAMIYTMYERGASRNVVIKMVMNSTLDAIIGAIPVLGTVFDVFYRSNNRNVKLLQEHYYEGKHQGSGRGVLIIIVLFALIVIASISFATWKFFQWVF